MPKPKPVIQDAPWLKLTYKIIGLAMRKSITNSGQGIASGSITTPWRSSSKRPASTLRTNLTFPSRWTTELSWAAVTAQASPQPPRMNTCACAQCRCSRPEMLTQNALKRVPA